MEPSGNKYMEQGLCGPNWQRKSGPEGQGTVHPTYPSTTHFPSSLPKSAAFLLDTHVSGIPRHLHALMASPHLVLTLALVTSSLMVGNGMALASTGVVASSRLVRESCIKASSSSANALEVWEC